MDETNATPSNEGASTLDRIERFLSPAQEPTTSTEPEAKATEPQAQEQPDDVPADGAEQEAQPQLSTTDLAKMLGVDESVLDLDEDGTPKFKTKIDGKEGAAKLAELLKSYQLEGHVNKKSMEVAEREKALQARAQQVEQQFSQELQNAQRLNQYALSELTKEFQSINWPALEQQDPGQAALLWQKYQNRVASIQGNIAQLQARDQQLQAQAQQRKQQMVTEEVQKLAEYIPEWKDDTVRAKEARELVDWGLKIGYSKETIERLNNSTALDVATFRKAMLYDQLQQQKAQVENKVRAAPKLVKPGQPATDSKEQKLQSLKNAVIKSGGKKGIAEYLIATGRA